MMALALVICAVVVSVALRSEPGRVAAEIARKSVREAQRYASGKHVEEPLGYGTSPSSEPVRQRKEEDAKEPVALLQQEPERSNSRSEMPQPAGQQTLSEPEFQPQQHQTQPQEKPLPTADDTDWAKPTQEELKSANAARHYELLPGAIMGLTIHSMGQWVYTTLPCSTQVAGGHWPKGLPTFQRPSCHGHMVLRGTSTWRDIAWVIGEPGVACSSTTSTS